MFTESISKNFDKVRQIAFSDLPIDEKMRLFESFDDILVEDFKKGCKRYVKSCFIPIKWFDGYAINPFGDVIVSWYDGNHLLTRDKSKGTVRLSNGRYERKDKSVHIMVAETFMKNPENKKYVNFKDGNKDNVRLDNLEYGTAHKKTNKAKNKDSSIRKDKLSVDEIIQVSEMLDAGEKHKKIAEKFNVYESTIWYVKMLKENGINPADMYIPMQTNKPKRVKCVETGKIYSSQNEAARDLNLARTAISKYFLRVGLGMETDVGGYHFEIVNEKEN